MIAESAKKEEEELQQEITYFHEQQQKPKVETFTAVGYLELQNHDTPSQSYRERQNQIYRMDGDS